MQLSFSAPTKWNEGHEQKQDTEEDWGGVEWNKLTILKVVVISNPIEFVYNGRFMNARIY